jgi:hypothetical protein
MTAISSLGHWKNCGEQRNKKAQVGKLRLGEIKCKVLEIGPGAPSLGDFSPNQIN